MSERIVNPLSAGPQSVRELLSFLGVYPWLECAEGLPRYRGLRMFLGTDERGWLVLRKAGGGTQRMALLSTAAGIETGLTLEPGGFVIDRGGHVLRYRYTGVCCLDQEPPAGEGRGQEPGDGSQESGS